MTKSTWFLLVSQSLLLAGLCLCFAILPRYAHSQSGVSNYGAHLETVVPYSLAFIIASVGALAAARAMPKQNTTHQLFARALSLLGVLYIAVLLSTYPYQLTGPFRNLHIATGMLLYGLIIVLATWCTFFIRKDILAGILFGMLLVGVGLTLISFFKIINYLLLGQMLTGLSFSLIIIRGAIAINTMSKHHAQTQPNP
jgi:hypothetical protein